MARQLHHPSANASYGSKNKYNTIKKHKPVIVIYARDGRRRRRRTVERRTRGLRPSHSRFSKGAMNHGRLEGKTSEKKEDEERTTRRKKWSTHESTIPEKNKRAPTVILNRHEGKKNIKVKGTNKKNKRQECSSRIFTFFFGFCFANLSLVWLLLLREGTIWNRQIMIFEHGCCQAAAAAHTGVKFFYNKKKSVWLSPSVSTVKKIKFKSLTKQKKPSSS